VVAVADEAGASIPAVRDATRRPTCSACGLSKRYLLNRVALEGGFPVVATGHNLDDEAATLLGSTLRWDESALARQTPVLAATHPKLVRRVKPLFRMSERETAAYAFLRGIDYIVEECPFSRGATHTSPGSKAMFLQGFLDRARELFQKHETVTLVECVRCGQTTTGEVCAFCKLRDQVKRAVRPADHALGPEPVDPPAERGLISDLHAASEIHAS
jgi:tRNA(Ile)-lysidine synthase TilS/MesJ